MTSLRDLRIYLSPWNGQWWFHATPVAALPPRKFAKACRNEAYVFAAVQLPEEVWLPNEEEVPTGDRPELPPELAEFRDVFATAPSKTLPPQRATDHTVDLIDGESPPFGPIYPLSQTELHELRKYIDENLANGRIRPSKSPAGAPILFVPKKDGSLRLCVDYRGLNKVTVKNRYPLPLISEILDRLAGAKYFSKIDVQDAYYRIRIREGDEWKTAFRTRYGHYEYTVMPFGLTNAPATFQNYIHTALHGLLDIFCVAYLDDILIFSTDRQSHTSHIHQVLERMRQAQLYAKPSKCSFYQDQVEFLGYVVTTEGISMDSRRIDAIVSWQEPQSFHDIQVFLGFCNFYRRFIQDYSRIALPLTALLKGSEKGRKPGRVKLALGEKIAFRRLIAAFQSAPLLRHFDPQRPIRLETDASNRGMAGILSQPDDEGRYHPVAFWSRKFSGAELNYGTPDQELFAIVHSFKQWRHYLEGTTHTVEVFSDHANLQAFMKQPKLNGRQARWCMFLTPFDFVIKHRAGKTNPADGPSRRSDFGSESAPRRELVTPLEQRLASVQSLRVRNLVARKSQFECGETPSQERPELDTRIALSSSEELAGAESEDWAVWEELNRERFVSQSEVRSACKAERVYVAEASTDLQDLIRRLQAEDPETQRRKAAVEKNLSGHQGWSICTGGLVRYKHRLYIPTGEGLRRELVRLYHDDLLAGHFGRGRTEELLRRKFHWVNLQADVAEYVKGCAVCQGTAAPRHRPYGKLESLPIPSRPFAELAMDFITGLPATYYRKELVDSMLVIVDRFTKLCHFFPVSTSINAAELAELFHTEIELKYGPPDGIVSDRGPVFTSKFWSKLCYISHVRLRLSTAFHPQTDGQTERMNQTLEHYLRCFVDKQQVNWPVLLRTAEFACNNAVNATIKTSPFQALLGYSPDFRLRTEDGAPSEGVPAVTARAEKLEKLRAQLKDQWREAVESQAKYYNQRHEPMKFKRGDMVALSTRNLRMKGSTRKLAPRFIGPFRVLDSVGKQAYRLGLPAQYSRLHNVFPVQLLEPWKSRTGEPLPLPDLEDDEEWEVEEVKAEEHLDGDLHFLVKWKGWPSEYNQWVPEADMEHAQGRIQQFKKSQRELARQRREDARRPAR